jgi:hypothetical protein
VVSWVCVALLHRTVAACTSCRRLGNTRPSLKICEPNCVLGAANPFFYSYGPQPGEGHGIRDSTEALLSGRRGRGHVAAPEPTSTGRRGPELRNTWQRRSSTPQGGETRVHGTCGVTGAHLDSKVRSGGCRTRGGFGAHLCRQMWFDATAYVAACGSTPCSLS